MRLYKFLNAKYGLKALQDKRLKISELTTLNDPFEQLPFDLSDPEMRKKFLKTKADREEKHGLFCFSRNWHNPVLWAHYSDNHKGLCLGFDASDTQCTPVIYIAQPYPLTNEMMIQAVTNHDLEFANKMLYSKCDHWAYEEEIRIWLSLEDRPRGHYFKDFDKDLRLAEVIVGMNSRITRRKLIQTLGRGHEGIEIRKVRPSYNAFKMVEDETEF